MRALLIGADSIGRRHLRNMKSLGVNDIHVYRHRPQERLTSIDGITVVPHESLEDALVARPEFAVIANPTSLQVGSALAAARQDCHLFLEKPLSSSLEGVCV